MQIELEVKLSDITFDREYSLFCDWLWQEKTIRSHSLVSRARLVWRRRRTRISSLVLQPRQRQSTGTHRDIPTTNVAWLIEGGKRERERRSCVDGKHSIESCPGCFQLFRVTQRMRIIERLSEVYFLPVVEESLCRMGERATIDADTAA
jgi:hypothetical protein